MTTRPAGLIIGDGNSIMAGHPASFVSTGFLKGAENLLNYGGGMTWVNIGQDGFRTDQMIARASASVDALKTAGPTNLVVVYEGLNDMAQGQCSALHVFERLKRYCGERRTGGFSILLGTVMPGNQISAVGLEPQRLALNTMIYNQYTDFADGLMDFAAHPTMGLEATFYPSPNLTYVAGDGNHPTQGGHDLLAPIAAAAIDLLVS